MPLPASVPSHNRPFNSPQEQTQNMSFDYMTRCMRVRFSADAMKVNANWECQFRKKKHEIFLKELLVFHICSLKDRRRPQSPHLIPVDPLENKYEKLTILSRKFRVFFCEIDILNSHLLSSRPLKSGLSYISSYSRMTCFASVLEAS
jgi:hypothetical protein